MELLILRLENINFFYESKNIYVPYIPACKYVQSLGIGVDLWAAHPATTPAVCFTYNGALGVARVTGDATRYTSAACSDATAAGAGRSGRRRLLPPEAPQPLEHTRRLGLVARGRRHHP